MLSFDASVIHTSLNAQVNFTNGDNQAWYTEGVGAWLGNSCVSSLTLSFNISLSSGSCISATSALLSTGTYSKFLGQWELCRSDTSRYICRGRSDTYLGRSDTFR